MSTISFQIKPDTRNHPLFLGSQGQSLRSMLATRSEVQYHIFQETPLDHDYGLYSLDHDS